MSQEEENQQKATGCLVLIVIAVLFGTGSALWDWATSPGGGDVQATISISVNERIVSGLRLGGPDCDMSGYDLHILDEKGRTVARKNLGKGYAGNVYCSYTVHMEIPEMSRFRVFIQTHSGDTKFVAKHVQWSDAVQADGSIRASARWTNQRMVE